MGPAGISIVGSSCMRLLQLLFQLLVFAAELMNNLHDAFASSAHPHGRIFTFAQGHHMHGRLQKRWIEQEYWCKQGSGCTSSYCFAAPWDLTFRASRAASALKALASGSPGMEDWRCMATTNRQRQVQLAKLLVMTPRVKARRLPCSGLLQPPLRARELCCDLFRIG